eukprot:6202859-Pleurochrysis_carterae.AAC.3
MPLPHMFAPARKSHGTEKACPSSIRTRRLGRVAKTRERARCLQWPERKARHVGGAEHQRGQREAELHQRLSRAAPKSVSARTSAHEHDIISAKQDSLVEGWVDSRELWVGALRSGPRHAAAKWG